MEYLVPIQFSILSLLMDDKFTSGPELRNRLARLDVSLSVNAFYKTMARLKASKFVIFKIDTKNQDRGIPQRLYRITPTGKEIWNTTKMLYDQACLVADDDFEFKAFET